MRIVISDTITETCLALTEALVTVMKNIPERDIYLAISGGSTPSHLFDLLSYRFEHKIDWKRVQLFWVDERCVPPSDKGSNYRMTALHLLSKLPFQEKKIHRIHGESNPEDEAKRYSEKVRKLLPWENGMPVFDLVLLGIGTDGHTASLFPGEEIRFSGVAYHNKELTNVNELGSNPIYRVTEKPENNQKRISMSFQLINRARNIFFLATGKEKSKIISDLYHHNQNSLQYPIAWIRPIDGSMIYFLDRDAVTETCYSTK